MGVVCARELRAGSLLALPGGVRLDDRRDRTFLRIIDKEAMQASLATGCQQTESRRETGLDRWTEAEESVGRYRHWWEPGRMKDGREGFPSDELESEWGPAYPTSLEQLPH